LSWRQTPRQRLDAPSWRQERCAIGERKLQAQYLRDLQRRQGLTLREIARRSRVFAEALEQPELAFKHQAVSSWLSGTRNPRPGHRRLLAMIFEVPLEDLNRGCDGVFDSLNTGAILKPVMVHVHGVERSYEYKLTLRSDIDLDRPAVYQSWAEIFRPWPAPLMRHFGRLKYTLFGWIPDTSASPMVRYPRSLVPLSTRRTSLRKENFGEQKIWFVYLPDGSLDLGIASREGRWLVLLRRRGSGSEAQKYPLARVDLVGYVTGKTLFHLGPIR
jgi:transcriptional regulator with XRE-family HTH domain